MKRSNRSLSSILREVSSIHNIPLSTLKFNANILVKYNLIEFYAVVGKKYVRLSKLGVKITNLIDGENNEKLYSSSIANDLNELSSNIKEELKIFLKTLNNFHLYSSLTTVDILLGILYHRILLNKDVHTVNLILSKGHATPALYIILKRLGLISCEDLDNIAVPGSMYQTHGIKGTPLIKVSTGSLGQGISIANGIALSMKMENIDDHIYVVLGDGEIDEGQIWEAAATAATYGLDNIIVVIDRNGKQLTGDTERIKKKEPIEEKWGAFGWIVADISLSSPLELLSALMKIDDVKGWPKVIIARRS